MNLSYEQVKNLFYFSKNVFQNAETVSIGKSWLSKDIICQSLGFGEPVTLVVGGFGGKDSHISRFLCDFAREVDSALSSKARISEFNVGTLLNKNKLCFIPILNPDGISVNNLGLNARNPFFGRVLKNGIENFDFTQWDSNSRGVCVYGNFNSEWIKLKIYERQNGIFSNAPWGYYGEYPESELETSSLCSFSVKKQPKIVVELRTGPELCMIPAYEGTADTFSKILTEYTGIRMVQNKDFLQGSFSSWASRNLSCISLIIRIPENFDNFESVKSAILLSTAI